MRRDLQVSERRACRALGQHRSTQRNMPHGRADEARLRADIIALARAYGRYGYRRITALLNEAGWDVSVSRVARIWRREGLKVPGRQPKRRRLWLADGSCIRLRPERPNHVWAYDFVEDRTSEGRKYRMLNIVDEFTRECLAIKVARKLNSMDVIETLADLFLMRGVPVFNWLDGSHGRRTLATELAHRHRFTIHSAPHAPSSVTSIPQASATENRKPPVAASDRDPSLSSIPITMPPMGAATKAPTSETTMFTIQPSTPRFFVHASWTPTAGAAARRTSPIVIAPPTPVSGIASVE